MTDVKYSNVGFKFKTVFESKKKKHFLFTEENICEFEVPQGYFGKKAKEFSVTSTEGVIYFTGISDGGKFLNFDMISNAEKNLDSIEAKCELRTIDKFKKILENEIKLISAIYETYGTYIKNAKDKANDAADYKKRMIRINKWKTDQIDKLNACKNQGSDLFNQAIQSELSKFSNDNYSPAASNSATIRPAVMRTKSGSAN